jgi:hypothetical protein
MSNPEQFYSRRRAASLASACRLADIAPVKADDYRSKAQEMRKLAEHAPSPELREQYMALAKGWEELAKDADAMQRNSAAKPGRW